MGLLFGVFMGSMDTSHNYAPELQNMTLKESLKQSWKVTKSKSVGFAKNFATVGFFYSGFECAIEKVRQTPNLVCDRSDGYFSLITEPTLVPFASHHPACTSSVGGKTRNKTIAYHPYVHTVGAGET